MVVPREALPVVDFEETLPPEEVAEEELLLLPVDLEVVFPPEEEDDVLLLEEDEVDFQKKPKRKTPRQWFLRNGISLRKNHKTGRPPDNRERPPDRTGPKPWPKPKRIPPP